MPSKPSFPACLVPRWRANSELMPLGSVTFGVALTCLMVGASSSCVPDLADDASLVRGERVLAIVAEPPEAGEGDSVSLTALVASAVGDVSSEVSYFSCLARKPLSELGPVAPSCLAGSAEERVLLGRGSGAALLLDRGVCGLFGPRRPGAEPGQPAGRAADPDATGGFYQPVMAELPGETAVLGGVRLDCGLPAAERTEVIEYNQRHRANQNPRLERLELEREGVWLELAENGARSVRAGERVALRASWAACPANDQSCTGAEAYVMFDAEEQALVERTEVVIASWYATAGEFDEHRTEAADATTAGADNGWSAPLESGPVSLWVVLRDGRGGVGHAGYQLTVE